MNPLRIVFAGTPEFALPSLNALALSAHRLLAVYTQPDRPAGRGRKLTASPVKNWAEKQQLPVYQPLNFKTPEAIDELAALQPDVLVVIAYGLILPQAVLDIPRLGCVNVHASLLPRWRGASPIQHAILHGDEQTGVTIMQMDSGMDTGAMLMQAECSIASDETGKTLHDKLASLAPPPLLDTLNALAEGNISPTPQAHSKATYAPKISKQDAFINWQQPAVAIARQIRAFNPWPVAYTKAPDTLVRIIAAETSHQSCPQKPGTILTITKEGIGVVTGDGLLVIKTLQFPGTKVLAITDWLNAKHQALCCGMVLS